MRSDTYLTLIFIFTAMFYLVYLLYFKSLFMSKKFTNCGCKIKKKVHFVTFYFTDSISEKVHCRFCPQYVLHYWDVCDALIHKADAGK